MDREAVIDVRRRNHRPVESSLGRLCAHPLVQERLRPHPVYLTFSHPRREDVPAHEEPESRFRSE